MKILIDARMYGLEHSGIGRYLINLVKELIKISNLPPFGADRKISFSVLLRKKYFNKLNLPENWYKVLADFRHYSLSEQIFLPKIIQKEKPDVVHFPHLNIPIFWKGRFVVTIHDLTMQKQGTKATTLPLPLYYLKRLPFLLIAKKAAIESTKIIVPSQTVKNEIVSYYGIDAKKVAVIYEGVSFLPQNSQDKSGDVILAKYGISMPYFFYAGNAYPHKNLQTAIQAIKLLNIKTKKKILFVIGGSRDVFTERLNDKVKKFEAGNFVKRIGYVSDEDLAALFRNSIAFLYPSLSEGFGLQGLEAMVNGTLLLASDIPVFKEVYKNYAFYFNPLDPKSMEKEMQKAMSLKFGERKKIIDKSYKFSKLYSWQKMARETLAIYESILG